MKTRTVLLIIFAAFSVIDAFSQSVVITPKKTVYTRTKPISDYKRNFTITYPVVKAATPALSKKIQTAIDYRSNLGLSLKEELGEIQWLEEADYEVGYNEKGVLSISLSMNGSGAYPSGVTKVIVVNLRTGSKVKAIDVFTNLPGLTALVRKAQKKEIADAIISIRKNDPQETDPKSLFKGKTITAKSLEGFSVNAGGITFNYDYGFPHVIQALEPDGTFMFTWRQLRPYIKAGGLLTRLAR